MAEALWATKTRCQNETTHIRNKIKAKQIQLERTVDGAPSQIPTLKFLTPHSTHKSHPGA